MRPMTTAKKETVRRVMVYRMRRKVKKRGAMVRRKSGNVYVIDSCWIWAVFWYSWSYG